MEAGFTLVEVMIAATVMLVGMLGVALMLDQASTATYSTKAREQGIALQRELLEAARAIPYDQLVNNGLVAAVQGTQGTGLSDSGSDAGWTIRRRDFTYAVSIGVCSVDDPGDGLGAHDTATFCASGSGKTTPDQCSSILTPTSGLAGASGTSGYAVGDCGLDRNLDGAVDNLVEASGCPATGCGAVAGAADKTPDDYKRIVTLVRWDRGTGRRFALQSSTVSNPGLSSAPAVTQLTTSAGDPITSANSASFTATVSRTPAAVSMFVDGTQVGTATGSGTSWSYSWNLGNVSATTTPNAGEIFDGSYVVSAKAFDSYGTSGSHRALTLRLNRRVPYPPTRFEAGRNGGSLVDFEWARSKERDVERYRVYRVSNDGSPNAKVCDTVQTACQDTNASQDPTISYYVVAVDKDATGALREGNPSAIDTVTLTNTAPGAPGSLSASSASGNTILIWSASSTPADVSFYRIYRDGVAYADRYDRTSTAAELTFIDTKTGGISHSYWVAAVDSELAESTKRGPVTR